MKEELISVIVPIYNVEKYIRKCIDSILAQTYKNLEVILVDDGSPDNCGNICDYYSEMDKRIKVIHKQNGGLSDARNAGLEIASGEYIGFIDSDDYIHPDMYRLLHQNLVESKSDIAECAVERIYKDKVINGCTGEVKIFSGEDALRIHLESDGEGYMPRTAVWSKLFRRKLWEGVRFPKGHIHEDYLITTQMLYRSKSVCCIDKCLYTHIYTNSSSITQVAFSKKDLYKEYQYRKRMEFLKEVGLDEHYKFAEVSYYKLLLQFYYKCFFAGMNEAEHYKKLLFEHKEVILDSRMGTKKNIEFRVFYLNPNFYLWIREIIAVIRKGRSIDKFSEKRG